LKKKPVFLLKNAHAVVADGTTTNGKILNISTAYIYS